MAQNQALVEISNKTVSLHKRYEFEKVYNKINTIQDSL